MILRQAAFAASAILLLAGCSGEKEVEVAASQTRSGQNAHAPSEANIDPSEHGAEILWAKSGTIVAKPLRHEFVVMREIVRQHELQQGNDKRIEAVEKALKEKFPTLPDTGQTDEEREIHRSAARLMKSLQ